MRNYQISPNNGHLAEFYNLLNSLVGRVVSGYSAKNEKDFEFEDRNNNAQYLSAIVHDLKSPIACADSLCDLLQGDIESGESRETLLDNINDLRQVNKELNELVHDLLDANISSRQNFYKTQFEDNVDIASICERAIKLNTSFAIRKEIKLCQEVASDLVFDKIDSRRLKQILTNLISNALKYSSVDTEVVLKAEIVDDKLEISVKDQGCGISEENLNKIFKRNVMLNNETSNDSHGIGLAIVQDLVQAMNGKIFVTSKLNEGSEFRVVFGD